MLERFEDWPTILLGGVLAAKLARSNWIEPEHILVAIILYELSWVTEQIPDKNLQRFRSEIEACNPQYEAPVGSHRALAASTKKVLAQAIERAEGTVTPLHMLVTLMETGTLHASFVSVLNANGLGLEAIKNQLAKRSRARAQAQ
jgi:hypothetical protein